MTGRRRNLLKATCFALSLTGATAVAAIVMTPDLAFAKNAKSQSASSKSQGSTQKGSKSQGSKSGKSGGVQSNNSANKSNSHGPKALKLHKYATGAHPSELGALNAAHANENALLNASPNSRVGRVAAYRDVVRAGILLDEELEAAKALLDGLDEPERTSEEVDFERGEANDELTEINEDLSDLDDLIAESEAADRELGLTEDGDATKDLKDDRDTLTDTKNSLEDEIAGLDTEFDAAEEYEMAVSDIDDLQEQVDDQPALETATLEAAANKPVTQEVENAVKILLGLE